MPNCTLKILDEINCKFVGLDLDVRKFLQKKFKIEDPTARYRPSYRLGRWDGSVSFFGIGGDTYLSMIEPILKILEEKKYTIEVEDLRVGPNLEFEKISEDFWGDLTWPEGHRFSGEKIRLREDQVDIVNKFLENPQCLQEIATGFGKCLAGETLINISIDENSDFGKFIINKLLLESDNDVTRNKK